LDRGVVSTPAPLTQQLTVVSSMTDHVGDRIEAHGRIGWEAEARDGRPQKSPETIVRAISSDRHGAEPMFLSDTGSISANALRHRGRLRNHDPCDRAYRQPILGIAVRDVPGPGGPSPSPLAMASLSANPASGNSPHA